MVCPESAAENVSVGTGTHLHDVGSVASTQALGMWVHGHGQEGVAINSKVK